MSSDEILLDAEERMDKALSVLREELRGIRTGRASPALVDTLRVEYYGSPTPLRQLATISTPDAQSILIKPFDPGGLKDIEKAIIASGLGLAPNNDGKVIRLNIPPMSGEQRAKMTTRVKKLAEESKVAIRNIRRDANKAFDGAEKNKEMTEDERDSGKGEVQKLTDAYEAKVQDLADKKMKEIMDQ
ncbi:MAG TPA: ribosome recycling factor [Gemmatales bacterium]|nr:ribosome recycling factor [Gemmatales bacterium]HMP58089.1 ribosome recycling factor [Gemmatales bacterium]